MSNITKLSDSTNDSFMLTPTDTLEDAINLHKEGGSFEGRKKVLVLSLDDTDGKYEVNFLQSGMRMSDCLALCVVAKTIFLDEMNYINQD